MTTVIKMAAVGLCLLAAAQAHAGGLWLNEYGDYAGARAAAGSAAGSDGAGAIIYNPASVTMVENGELFVAAGALVPQAEFDIDSTNPILGNDDGGDAGEAAPGAAAAYVTNLGTDDWSFGVSLAGLAGAGLDYGDTWVGRYQVTEVTILLMAMQVSIGYQVTDKLSIGFGPQVYYSELDLDVNLLPLANPGGPDAKATLDGDDTGFGFQAGFIYEAADDIRIGVKYQSELDIDYGGGFELKRGFDQALIADIDTDTELTMAQVVRVGIHYDLTQDLGLDLSWGWDDWSALDQVFVSGDGPGSGAGLKKSWEDTYHYAVGLQYALNDKWEISTGFAYDTNPVSRQDRTADLPVDRQYRYNAGTRYQHSDNLSLGGYIAYADLGEAPIQGRAFSGEYGTNELWGVSVFLNWQL